MLMKKGAEANLYLEDWHGHKVIMKQRPPKKYRVPKLDEAIRFYRTIHESQLIHKAKETGVPTPTIFMVDIVKTTIIMEFVEGKQIKQILNGLSSEDRQRLCCHIGELIGQLHNHGVIHSDLTTSNMILTPQNKVVFVDFGLSEQSKELEVKGVDLHLMKRALQSTHYKHVSECFDAIMGGYTRVVGDDVAKDVLKKIQEIERRGRYVSER